MQLARGRSKRLAGHHCAQAESMASQMQGMSDGQLKMMVKAAGFVAQLAKAARYILANKLLALGILILVLALLLRWFGVL